MPTPSEPYVVPMTPCKQCGALMNPVEALMGEVCGKCCRKNHRKAVTGR